MYSFSIFYSLYRVLELNPKTCANTFPTELYCLSSVIIFNELNTNVYMVAKNLKCLLCDWACESIGRVHA